jgi:hypothetical protein
MNAYQVLLCFFIFFSAWLIVFAWPRMAMYVELFRMAYSDQGKRTLEQMNKTVHKKRLVTFIRIYFLLFAAGAAGLYLSIRFF